MYRCRASAKYLQDCLVTAVDISPAALAVAARNAERHGVSGRVRFIRSDLFGSVPAEKYDVLVSNPPYVRTEDLERLQPEVRLFEPLPALDGGKRRTPLLQGDNTQGTRVFASGRYAGFRKGYDQAKAVARLMGSGGMFSDIEIYRDLSGIESVGQGSLQFKQRHGDIVAQVICRPDIREPECGILYVPQDLPGPGAAVEEYVKEPFLSELPP